MAIFIAPIAATLPGHQLHVVDNNEIEAIFGIEAARFGANIVDTGGRRIINKDARIGQHVGRLQQDRPLFLMDRTQAQPVTVDAGFHGQQTLYQLIVAHFQAEEGDARGVALSGILRNGKAE